MFAMRHFNNGFNNGCLQPYPHRPSRRHTLDSSLAVSGFRPAVTEGAPCHSGS
jgi:hypothetical protein